MTIIKSIIIAFSLYSKIPMPVFEWDEKNYKHAIAFLPFIGIIIGALSHLVFYLAVALGLPVMVTTLFLILIPILITGGFHVDGFMDVSDALHSYQPREKKLEIMKDPHIGAFAVISVGTVLLLWTSFLYLLIYRAVDSGEYLLVYLYEIGFAAIRALCGITSIVFPRAKKDGMLNMEAGKSGRWDILFLIAKALISIDIMIALQPVAGIVSLAAMLLFSLWYWYKTKKEFGGVTGDTAGFFVVTGELFVLIALSVYSLVISI